MEFVVHRGCGEDFAEACAYLVYLLVGGGERVLQGCAEAHTPQDSVDGVVPAGEGLLWPGGRVVLCVGACLDLCVGGGDGPDPGRGSLGWPAPLDPLGQAGHGQR